MRIFCVLLLLHAAAGWQLDSSMEIAADRLTAVCDRCDGGRIADVERLIHDRFPLFLNPTSAVLKPNSVLDSSDDDDEPAWDILGAAEKACMSIKNWTDVGFSRQCQHGLEDAVCSVAELVQAIKTSCSVETGTEAECHRCTIEKAARTGRSLWVIKLLDSMGKLPAGLTEGNFLWLGDYEQCTQLTVPIELPDQRIRVFAGQYCKANLGLPPTKQKAATAACSSGRLVDADGCAPVEDTLFIQYGICAPSTCSADELTALVRKVVPLCHSFVECNEEDERELTVGTAFFLSAFGVFLALVIGGTLVDLYVCRRELKEIEKDKQTQMTQVGDGVSEHYFTKSSANYEANYYANLDLPMRLLVACSMYSNGKQALNTKRRPEQIASLDGLRLFSMMWLIYGNAYHYVICYLRNVTFAGENAASLWYQSLNNVTVAIDTFFVISGCIVSFRWLKKVQSGKHFEVKGVKAWLGFYLEKYFRFTPLYIIVIAFTATVFPYLAAGPMWDGQNFDFVENCRTSWWRNLLYVNNFFKSNESCLEWTWYLANDMQFFWLTPPLLMLINAAPLIAAILSSVLIGASVLAQGFVIAQNNYVPTLMTTVEPATSAQIQGFVEYVYTKPWMRLSPFVIGLLLGYLLNKSYGRLRINKWIVVLVWILVIVASLGVVFGLHGYASGESSTSVFNSLYAGAHRPVWAFAIAAVIFMCFHGYGGPIDVLLSWRPLGPLSRLTDSAYLIHGLVLHYSYASLHRPVYGSHWTTLYYAIATAATSYGIAFALHVVLDKPLRHIQTLVFDRWLAPSPTSALNGQKRSVNFSATPKKTLIVKSSEKSPPGDSSAAQLL